MVQKLFETLSRSFELSEIVFYDAIKDRTIEPEKYAEQQRFHEDQKSCGWPVTINLTKLQYRQNVTRAEVDSATRRIGIVDACKGKIWALLESLKLISRQKEKGVDVWLASDAIEIALTKRCETIIIFSGDADFVPAVKLIQRYGGRVINLHLYDGSSKELRDTCQMNVLLEFDEAGEIKLTQFNNVDRSRKTI
jgi:uncharacterized LabA/DUF88 family protein